MIAMDRHQGAEPAGDGMGGMYDEGMARGSQIA